MKKGNDNEQTGSSTETSQAHTRDEKNEISPDEADLTWSTDTPIKAIVIGAGTLIRRKSENLNLKIFNFDII